MLLVLEEARYSVWYYERDSYPEASYLYKMVVLQVSNADKIVAECLPCVLRLPRRKACR